jgi:cobalt/nickel transport system ATP-binding protein
MKPLLNACNLSYTYHNGHKALCSVSFTLAAGEKVALIGANGAGKSTLLLCLAGLIWGNGSISFSGNLLTRKNIHNYRSKIGITFQDPNDQLFCPTVLEDVAYGALQMGLDSKTASEQAEDILIQLGLAGFGKRSAHHLSVGERRRAALATVLVMHPEVLLLDEPSAFLDPRGRRELIQLLHNLPEAMLLATHDMEMALELCPRTMVMSGGMIIADSESRSIMTDESLMLENGLEVPTILQNRK